MTTDDKMIAATLAAALLQKQPLDPTLAPGADSLVKLYFECLEALRLERQRRGASLGESLTRSRDLF